MDQNKAILVVAPAWVGDMVLSHSLVQTLKIEYPACSIDYLAPSWSLPLIGRMPGVRQGVTMPLGHGEFGWGVRRALGKSLQKEHYDMAVVLPNSWKSALIPYFAAIPRRVGYWGEARLGLLNDGRRLDKKRLAKTVERFVALALAEKAPLPTPFPVPQLRVDEINRLATLNKLGLPLPEQPLLILSPGAEYGSAKRWPTDHFAEVARSMMVQGWQVWLLGSAKDRAIAQEVADLAPGCYQLAGKTQLVEAVDLISLADWVVSNDSGLMHVAAALGKKILAIYGSSDPNFTPPMDDQAQILSLNLTCSPCFLRQCPHEGTPCLSGLSPAMVLSWLNTSNNQ